LTTYAFDFIKPERHRMLKKVLGIGALFGVLLETIKKFSQENAGTASFFAFCSLFVFVWLVHVFEEGGSEVIEAVDKAEAAAFSSRKAFSVGLATPPSADLVKKVRDQVKELLTERFPAGRGAEINDYADQRYLFRTQVYRDSLCACDVSARFRLKTVRETTPSPTLKLTEEPAPYIASVDVAIERKSELRNILTISALSLVGISGIFQLFGSEDGTGARVVTLLTAVVLLGAVPCCISAWAKMSRWFPNALLTTLRSDIMAILAENDFLENSPGTEAQTEPRSAFWNVPGPKRHRRNALIGIGVSVICATALWWYLRPKTFTIQDGEEALHAGDYRKAIDILLHIAQDGNMEAREQLQKYEDSMSPIDESYVRKRLAAMGYAPAQFEIAYDAYYERTDTEDAPALMKKASGQGFSDAQAVMADWYFDGSGVVADKQEANRLYALAAAQGNHHAQFRLCEFALKHKRYRQAYYWLRICADEGPHPSLIIIDKDCPRDNGALEKKLNTKQRDAVARDVSEFLEENHLDRK
jgi:hypothetical protein